MSAAKRFKPEISTELRAYKRVDIYRSDGFNGFIVLGKSHKIHVEIYDLNPFGACIVIKNSKISQIDNFDKIEIEFTHANGNVSYKGKQKWRKNHHGNMMCGIEFIDQLAPIPVRRGISNGEFPVVLPEFFSLSGFFYKPYLFFERGTFKVLAISEAIWKIQFFESDCFFFKSQRVDLWLLGSSASTTPFSVEIINLEKGPNGSIIIQCHVPKLAKKLSSSIAQQLVFICGRNPVELRNLGFNVTKVSNGFRFRFVKTQDEYKNVLKLRYKAYLEAGKISENKTIADMVAPMDDKSRILICLHGDKIVASVAIAFPSSNQEILDTEKMFPNGYPRKMPDKTRLVEIARLCTDSAYRRTDLLERMFEYTYKVTICGDREFILTSTDNRLWKIYKKLGFKKTGMSYAHPYLSGMEHHIILGHRNQPDNASKISPLSWNYIWRDMNVFMEERGLIKIGVFQRIRLKLYMYLGKILRIKEIEYY